MERFRKLVMAKNPEEYSPKPASVHSHPTNVADQVTEPTENSARQSFGGCKRPTLSGKHWTLRRLLDQSSHFIAVPRISASSPQLAETLEAYERDGKPLIIEDWHEHPKWPRELFNIDWLLKKSGEDSMCSCCTFHRALNCNCHSSMGTRRARTHRHTNILYRFYRPVQGVSALIIRR